MATWFSRPFRRIPIVIECIESLVKTLSICYHRLILIVIWVIIAIVFAFIHLRNCLKICSSLWDRLPLCIVGEFFSLVSCLLLVEEALVWLSICDRYAHFLIWTFLFFYRLLLLFSNRFLFYGWSLWIIWEFLPFKCLELFIQERLFWIITLSRLLARYFSKGIVSKFSYINNYFCFFLFLEQWLTKLLWSTDSICLLVDCDSTFLLVIVHYGELGKEVQAIINITDV